MTRPAFLVFVSVRALAAMAALLALSVVLTACGDAEEEVGPDVQPSATVSPSSSVSPVPLTATPAATTPTNDWKTYTDAEASFTIGHPPGLSLAEEAKVTLTGGGKQPEVTMRILTFRSPSGARALDVGIVENSGGLSAEDWVADYDPCASDYDPNLPQRYATTVAGYPAILCPVDQLSQVNPRVYVAIGRFVFVLVGNVNGLPESGQPAGLSQAEFDGVLASFGFSE